MSCGILFDTSGPLLSLLHTFVHVCEERDIQQMKDVEQELCTILLPQQNEILLLIMQETVHYQNF